MAHLLHNHIVTYAGNAHTLPHAVTAARRAWPASPVTILDDARHPVPPSMQQDLENHPQIQYRPTHWERGGNLRGRTCLRGLLAEYKRSLRQTEAPYVLKLDADTLVLNPATLNTLILQGVDYGTHSTLDGPFGGGCILMSSPAVRALDKAVRLCPLVPYAREDKTLNGLAMASGLSMALLDGNTPCTDKPVFFTGIDTRLHDQKDYVDRMSANVAVANVGTSKLTGAELLTEAYMASALLDTITTRRVLNMDKPGRKKPEKVA